MKRIALWVGICLIVASFNNVSAQQQACQSRVKQKPLTTIILVRHAEKVADGSKDPPLSEQGHQRAGAFARMLSMLKPDAIYSSNYIRTISTARPLAEQNGLAIQTYDPGDQQGFLNRIILEHQGGTIVVVGHSNTIPFAVNHLLKEDLLEELSETEYEKVFIVSVLSDGRATLLPLLLEL